MEIEFKIYISGPITNNETYINDFKIVEKQLTDVGCIVLSPIKNDGFSYKDYIDIDIVEMSKCNAIMMLEGWSKSKGSILEYIYARTNNYTIIYENNFSFLEGGDIRIALIDPYGEEKQLFLDDVIRYFEKRIDKSND